MTEPRWRTRREAQENGWFSRRHETDAAHRAAREEYITQMRGRKGRQLRAKGKAPS